MATKVVPRPTRPSCRFVDKVAIVTGGSSGLGLEVALLLAREGACVTLTGRDEKRLADAKESLQTEAEAAAKEGGAGTLKKDASDKFLTVSGDVARTDARKSIVDQTIATFGRLDILVCNAAIFPSQAGLLEATEETFDQVMSTNVKAVFFLIQLAVPHLEKTKGNILNVSSVLSFRHMPMTALYNASKATVDNLTAEMALVLAPKGVRVNAVSPSYIPTRLMRHFAAGPDCDQVDEAAQQMANLQGPKHPLHGRCATPEEFANLVLFLASDEARYITGQVSVVDAGVSLVGAFSGGLD